MPHQFEVNFLNFNLVARQSEPAYFVVTVSKSIRNIMSSPAAILHELSCCNPHRQPGRIRSGNHTNAGLRTPRGYSAGTGHRAANLGRYLRSRTGIADSNSPSPRAGDDRLRALRDL